MSRDKLTILQVSPSDIGGGAEKVATELHRSYLARGLDPWLAVGKKLTDDPRVVSIPNAESVPGWTRTLTRAADAVSRGDKHRGGEAGRRDRKGGLAWALDRALRFKANPAHFVRVQRGLEDFDFPGTGRLLDLTPTPPDILHLHNLHGGYFDLRMLPALSRRVPTVVTMHDVWLLTGHCAYPLGCERWKAGCGDCPDLDLPLPIRRDASAQNARIKRRALADGRVHLAAPSRWLMGLAEEAGVAQSVAETRVIPNGVDTSVFHPGNRAEARAQLGLPQDATIVLFSARSAKSSPFKGFETLEAALPLIARAAPVPDLLLVALGEDAPDSAVGGVPIRFVPFAADPAVVARYYQAADLYLHPARAENFPLAVLEAMACGTAVIASDTGGIPEIVTDGETGLLFANGDAGALAAAGVSLLRDAEHRSKIGQAGLTRVGREFTIDLQATRYVEWYNELTRLRGFRS